MDLWYNLHLQVIKIVFIFWHTYLDSPHSVNPVIYLIQSWCPRECSQQLGKLYQSCSNNGIAINSISYVYFILNRYLQEESRRISWLCVAANSISSLKRFGHFGVLHKV
jgi:hypothetical protein